eukprot:gene7213-8377_t
MNVTQKIAEAHVLIGSKFYQDEYETFSRETVYTIENSIITDKSDPRKQIKILFDEICYNKDYKPYRFFCVEYPLIGGTGIKPSISQDSDDQFGIVKPQKPTFDQASQFLLSGSLYSPNSIVIRKLDAQLQEFESVSFDQSTETQVKESLRRIQEKYMDDLVCANAEYKQLQSNEKQMNNLSQILECYMFGKLYDTIYVGLQEIYREKNNYYYERILALSNMSLEELGINSAFTPHLSRAVETMLQFSQDVTPIDKLLTIIQASNDIENSIKTSSLLELNDETLTITGDDALPLIYSEENVDFFRTAAGCTEECNEDVISLWKAYCRITFSEEYSTACVAAYENCMDFCVSNFGPAPIPNDVGGDQ